MIKRARKPQRFTIVAEEIVVEVLTKLLDRAISEVQKLSDAEQDTIAALILDRIADDQAWKVPSLVRSTNWLKWPGRQESKFVPADSVTLSDATAMRSRVTEDFVLS